MAHYTLFLDEIHTGGHFDHFSLVGFAISDEDYKNRLIPRMNQLKQDMFGDTSVIIHEQEINTAKAGTPFRIFDRNDSKRKQFWERVIVIINELKIPIFAVCIHKAEYSRLYNEGRPMYEVALQLILENYIHFLQQQNGTGDIQCESTNAGQDLKLQHHFYHLMANGTLFYERKVFQSRIRTINFPPKSDNVIGLQLADLLPNSLNRDLTTSREYEQRTYGLIDVIKRQLYDGGCDNASRFGAKVIPL
jgi:hypothetical protein